MGIRHLENTSYEKPILQLIIKTTVMTQFTDTNNTNADSKKIVDSIKVRGIAAAIQSMSFPSFVNLDTLLNKVGYKLMPINKNASSEQNLNQLQ